MGSKVGTLLYFKPVAYTPDGFNILRLGGIVLNFFPYFFDMNGNGSNISNGIHIPDLPEKLFLGIDMIGVFCQEGQKVKFLAREGLFHTVYSDSSCCLVNADAADFNNVIGFGAGTYQPIIPGHVCLYAGNQLAGAERLGHVIVCTKTKSPDLINVVFFWQRP